MYKYLKKKLYFTSVIVIMIVYVLPMFFPIFYQIVYGADPASVGYGEWNDIPDDCGDVYTYMGWQLITAVGSEQMNLINAAGGREFDEEGYGIIDGCYVIACTHQDDGGLARVGDYIDFELEDGTVLTCMVGDIKASQDEGWSIWGHLNGRCTVEFVVDKDTWYSGGEGSHANPGQGNGKMDQVLHGKKVVRYFRRGNYLDGDRLGGDGIAAYAASKGNDLTDFFAGIRTVFSGIWDAISVSFENLVLGREDGVVLYDLNDKDDNGSSAGSNVFGGTILEVCEQMAQYLASKGGQYGATQWTDIELSLENPDHNVVCVTYVLLVLWQAGVIPKELINQYNFHWTGDVEALLRAAGYEEVKGGLQNAQAGDVILHDPGENGHVMIYTGEGTMVWDQSSGMISSGGSPPTLAPVQKNYITDDKTTIWHIG